MFYLDNDEKQGQGHIKVISWSYCQKYVKKKSESSAKYLGHSVLVKLP